MFTFIHMDTNTREGQMMTDFQCMFIFIQRQGAMCAKREMWFSSFFSCLCIETNILISQAFRLCLCLQGDIRRRKCKENEVPTHPLHTRSIKGRKETVSPTPNIVLFLNLVYCYSLHDFIVYFPSHAFVPPSYPPPPPFRILFENKAYSFLPLTLNCGII